MKYLLILAVVVLVFGFIYWRLRPYISMARRALGFVRDLRLNVKQSPADMPRRSPAASNEKLVRCDACGTWTPASRAISMRSASAAYCSHACLERAAESPRRANKSAS